MKHGNHEGVLIVNTYQLVCDRSKRIANAVDWTKYGIDPASMLAFVTMITTFLNTVLPSLAQCLKINDDVSASTAQSRVRTMYQRNPERLHRRTKQNLMRKNKQAHRRDPGGVAILTDEMANGLATAIIDDAMNESDAETFKRVFAACVTAADAADVA